MTATATAPPDLSVLARVPASLVDLTRFCLWRMEPREEGDEPTKIPYAVAGYRAISKDPQTWAAWAAVMERYATDPAGTWNGVGFMLGPPIAGVDLDNALDDAGNLMPWAREWFDPSTTYGEVSPSGKGVKFFGRVNDWPEDRKGINLKGFGPDGTGGIEVYGRLRFFAVTGRRYHECPPTVNAAGHAFAGLYARLKLERERRKDADRRAEAAARPTPPRNGTAGRLDPFTRWTLYAAKMNPSHSGENGHSAFYAAMCEAVRFDLSNPVGMREAAEWWNENQTDEIWSPAEIEHKIRDAEREAGHERGCRLTEDRPGWQPHNGNGNATHNGNGNGHAPAHATPGADAPPTAGPLIPEPVPFARLRRDHPDLNAPLVEGLLRSGETMNLIASSKRGKTWLTYMLGLSVAAGVPWLGTFKTTPGRVLILDNELHRPTLAYRLPKVAEAMGLGPHEWEGRIDLVPLRGLNATIDHLRPFMDRIAERDYALIILDAFYRFVPRGMDENSNADVTYLYSVVDLCAEKTGAAFVLIHHASKGVQGQKAVTDVGSGAGAQSRAADAHVVLRDHEEDDAVVMQGEVRTFARPVPVGLRWRFPIWVPDPFLDPAKLKMDRRPGGRPRKDGAGEKPAKVEPKVWTPAEFAAEFVSEKPRAKELILAKATAAEMTERQATRMLLLAVEDGRVFRHTFPKDLKSYYANREQDLTDVSPSKSAHIPLTHTPPRTPRVRRKKSRRTTGN